MDYQWKQDFDEMTQLSEMIMWEIAKALPEGEQLDPDLFDIEGLMVPWDEYESYEYDSEYHATKQQEGWE